MSQASQPSQSTPNQSVRPLTFEIDENGQAVIGGVNMIDLARRYGTPLYVIDAKTFRTMADVYTNALSDHYSGESRALYASKANLNMGMAAMIDRQGLGFDVVSGGELYTAIEAGVSPDKIVFNGNNKSKDEILMALEYGIDRITVDNPYELGLIHELAEKKGAHANVLLRVTPGIECHTHEYIKTGQVDSKFGFNLSDLPEALNNLTTTYKETITLKGLHAHIGSQIFETQPYLDLIELILNIYYNIRESFDGLVMDDINLGGGMGIAYTDADSPPQVADTLKLMCEKLTQYAQKLNYPLPRLLVEPGRSMIATAGVTLYEVGSWKVVPEVRKYIAVDGGMGDNIRPALYQSEYSALIANKANWSVSETVTVAGKFCESGDILIESLNVPAVESGDILMVFGTGAYNYAMASNYNRVPRPAMVLVDEGQSYPLVRRESYANLLAMDVVPTCFQTETVDEATRV